MIEARGGPGLPNEAFSRVRCDSVFRRQNLDGHVAVESEFMCEIHRAHAAPAQQSLDAILETDRFLQGIAQRVFRPVA
jgi:hypothetical protein